MKYKYSRKKIAKKLKLKRYKNLAQSICDDLLAKPNKYAEEFENLLGNPIEQLDKLIDQAKQITEKAKTIEPRPVTRLKYAVNLNSLSIKLFGNGDPISILVSKLDEVIVELNKLIVNKKNEIQR
jgi:hypothetical protein